MEKEFVITLNPAHYGYSVHRETRDIVLRDYRDFGTELYDFDTPHYGLLFKKAANERFIIMESTERINGSEIKWVVVDKKWFKAILTIYVKAEDEPEISFRGSDAVVIRFNSISSDWHVCNYHFLYPQRYTGARILDDISNVVKDIVSDTDISYFITNTRIDVCDKVDEPEEQIKDKHKRYHIYMSIC